MYRIFTQRAPACSDLEQRFYYTVSGLVTHCARLRHRALSWLLIVHDEMLMSATTTITTKMKNKIETTAIRSRLKSHIRTARYSD